MRSPAPNDGTGAGWCSSRGGGVANVTACCRVAATWKGMLVSACLCVWLLSRVGRLRLSPGTLRDAPWSGCSAAAQGRGASGDWCGGEESAAIAQGMQGCDVQMRSSGPDEKTARLGLLFNYDPNHFPPYQLRPGPHARIHTTLYEAPAHAPTQRPRFGAAGQAALQFSISCCIEFHVAGQRPSHPAFPLPPFVAEHTHRTLRWSQSHSNSTFTIVFRTLMVPVRTGGLVSDPVADPVACAHPPASHAKRGRPCPPTAATSELPWWKQRVHKCLAHAVRFQSLSQPLEVVRLFQLREIVHEATAAFFPKGIQ